MSTTFRDARGTNMLAGRPAAVPNSSRRAGMTNGLRQASGSTYRNPLSHSVASNSSAASTSSSSRFSLSTAFVALTAQDIAFFDEVIDRLAAGAHDFASLKRAYNQVRMGLGQNAVIDSDKDAFLWDILLKLVKVRGKDWATRWDAVRMAIGMEPRVSSGSEPERSEDEDEDEEQVGETEAHTSDSETIRNGGQRERPSSQTRPGQGIDGATREEIEKLRERMAMLTAEAGSLAGSMAQKKEMAGGRQASELNIISPLKVDNRRRAPSHEAIDRRLRFVDQAQEPAIKRSYKATFVESASDEENPGPPSAARRVTSSASYSQKSPSTSTAQRQFDEVVARSRSERESQKRVQEEQEEAVRDAILLPQFSKADLIIKEHLARKCFDWWKLSCQQRRRREMQTVEIRTQLMLQKVMTAWRIKLRKSREKRRGAEKVDVVRCKLRAWRVWRRATLEAKQVRRDERKSVLKGAYLLTTRRNEQRIVEETFLRWKVALMERRTAHFRTQHLVRGAFSLWRLHLWREKTMNERQKAFSGRADGRNVHNAWHSWKMAHQRKRMDYLAQSFDRRCVLQNALHSWSRQREYKTVMRRKVALADRWRARRMKKSNLKTWRSAFARKIAMSVKADQVLARRQDEARAKSMKIWMLKERQMLFLRVRDGKEKAHAFHRWAHKAAEKTSRMHSMEARFAKNHRFQILRRSFAAWRTVTRQLVSSQQLAGERDRRKIKGDVMLQWRRASNAKRASAEQAKAVDAAIIQRRTMAKWLSRHVEFKGAALEQRRNEKTARGMFAFWHARALERRQEMLGVGLVRSKVESRLRKVYLRQWLDAVIRRRSVYLEAGERRDALLLNLAWSRWIDACVRHEDLLSLSNSFLDVKRDDLKKRILSRWTILARAERSRKERMEQFLQEKLRKLASGCLDQWYERYVDVTLREEEYEVLLLRQRKVTRLVFTHWKAQVKALPAIHLDHARRKVLAFSCWRERLPLARLANRAERVDRLGMLRKGFEHWHAMAKAKRSLRAAARFGGPSAARLGAAAHFRQRSRGSPFGKAGEISSSPSTRQVRSRSIEQPRAFKAAPVLHRDASSPTRSKALDLQQREEDDSSLRESDLVAATAVDEANLFRINNHSNLRSTRLLPSATPAFQGWMANTLMKTDMQHGLSLDETHLEDVATSSEPPSSVLEQRLSNRLNRRRQQATPSPPASQAQSEATARIRNSPRKSPQKTMDWLRMRKQAGDH